MVPTVIMALIKKEFMLLWRGTATPAATITVNGEQLRDLESGDHINKKTGQPYSPLDDDDVEEETRGTESASTTTAFSLGGESDSDEDNARA
jgi:hypothetical protein